MGTRTEPAQPVKQRVKGRVKKDEDRKRPPRPGEGRPSRIMDHEAIKILLNALRDGNYLEVAIAYAGMHKPTVLEWVKSGARERSRIAAGGKPDPELAEVLEFANSIEKARAESIARDNNVVSKAAAKGEWQAAAWRMERKHPELYGRRTDVKMSGGLNVTNDPQVAAALQTPEGRDALEKLYDAIRGGSGEPVSDTGEE